MSFEVQADKRHQSAAPLTWARETEFFALSNSGGWLQPYGKFFLEWYATKA